MNQDKPQLIASLIRPSDGEVRHLLLFFIDGSSETNLVQLVRGIETPLETGAEYETKQKASALLQLWAKEGFKVQAEGQLCERLEWTIPLALRLGHNVIYDSRLKQLDKLPECDWCSSTRQMAGPDRQERPSLRICPRWYAASRTPRTFAEFKAVSSTHRRQRIRGFHA
jgi:hypothetical protein